MPNKWPEDIYNYNTATIVHDDIEALDFEEGKWFKCKFCKNPKDVGRHPLRGKVEHVHV